MPTKIFFGQDSLKNLSHMDLGNVLIICDPFMEKSHKVDNLTVILEQQQLVYQIFSKVVPDPTIAVVTEGVAAAIQLSPKTIIALGGGSAIDTAKAVRQIYQATTKSSHIQLICIPTTSGTGSEVTSFSIISDPTVQTKYALVDDSLIPDVAILDPNFTVSVPSSVTADTGIDVLTHSLEAYVSTNASDFTDAYAEKAMKIIWENLVAVVKDGEDIAKREKIHNASCLAGIAFSEASLGVCHSLAHALGAKFHIPHGRANAMLLPYVISYNAGLELKEELPALNRYQEAAKLLGIQSGTPKATVHRLISLLSRQMKEMNIPKTVEELGIDSNEFLEAIPAMAEKAMMDKCTITNPRKPTIEELEELYKRLCKGGY